MIKTVLDSQKLKKSLLMQIKVYWNKAKIFIDEIVLCGTNLGVKMTNVL